MFNLLKRSKVQAWERQLLINIFTAMPSEYNYLIKQVEEGLLKGVAFQTTIIPNYVDFNYNGDVSRKFERKSDRGFEIKGVKVFDKLSNDYINVQISVAYGMVIGYATPDNKKVSLDVNKIDTSGLHVVYNHNKLYEKIKPLLTNTYIKSVSPDDVFEVELDGKIYYHLKDLDNGDFIGMDSSGRYYEITHDPYEIKEIS